MFDMKTIELLGVWSDLEEALRGESGFGGDTAEIYAFHLVPYSPSSYPNGRDEKTKLEHAKIAGAALKDLLILFTEHHNCKVTIYDEAFDQNAPARPFDHRCAVRVIKGSRAAERRAIGTLESEIDNLKAALIEAVEAGCTCEKKWNGWCGACRALDGLEPGLKDGEREAAGEAIKNAK